METTDHSAEGLTLGDRLERAVERRGDVEAEIARGEAEARRTKLARIRKTAIWLGVTGVSLYLVFPSILEVAGSWKQIDELAPGWLLTMGVLQAAVLVCLWQLQRIALKLRRWQPVIASQLAGNALAKVAPGGGAMGAALQYRMLVQTGVGGPRAISALTAVNMLTFAVVLALPVLALPALLRGGVDRSLLEAALLAILLLVLLSAIGVVLLAFDRPLHAVARLIQRVRNRLRRKREPLTTLPARVLRERDRLLATLGPRWKSALVAASGRWAFDYATLLAALAAIGADPRPGLVLLAFAAAQLLAQIPVTPGGLGFVEAGLTGMLALAGISAGHAVLATFAYRLFSYWLQLPLGLVGLALQRRIRVAAADVR